MTIPDEGCYTEILNKQLLSYFRENSFVGYCISSSYAKILGETNFHAREIPRSGSKAKDGEKRKKDIKYVIAMPPQVAHVRPSGLKMMILIVFGPGGLRAPCVLACATRGGGRSEAGHCFHLLFFFFFFLFFFYTFCFSPTSGKKN